MREESRLKTRNEENRPAGGELEPSRIRGRILPELGFRVHLNS